MNNAALFFPHEKDDDLWELYEERLFEDKQFFTLRAVIPSLFVKRFDKIIKREEAFRQLTNTQMPTTDISDFPLFETSSISEAYKKHQAQKAKIFQLIFLAKDAITLIILVQQLIKSFTFYTSQWELKKSFDANDILISKDPEPVALSKAIQSFENAGGKTIEDLDQLTFDGKETFLSEAKRLSLWRKKEIGNGNF